MKKQRTFLFISLDRIVIRWIKQFAKDKFVLRFHQDSLKSVQELEEYEPELILFDTDSQSMSIQHFVQELRKSSLNVPIVLFATKNDTSANAPTHYNEIIGLVEKPFNALEFETAIFSALRYLEKAPGPSFQVLDEVHPNKFVSIEKVKAEAGSSLREEFEEAKLIFDKIDQAKGKEAQYLLFFELVSLINRNPYYLSLVYTIQRTCFDKIMESEENEKQLAMRAVYHTINSQLKKNDEDLKELYSDISQSSAKVYMIKSFLHSCNKTLSMAYKRKHKISKSELQSKINRIQKLYQFLPTQERHTSQEKFKGLQKDEKLVVITKLLLSFLQVQETLLYNSLNGKINKFTITSLGLIENMYLALPLPE